MIACIDAGGTATRLRVEANGTVVHDGVGGPGNPYAADHAVVRRSFADAAEGSPTPGRLMASVAGTGSEDMRDLVSTVLREIFPRTEIQVVPDYAGCFLSCRPGTSVCVIAGTGSVVTSPQRDGAGWNMSGGRGWLLGDAGSAADLGRTFLSRYVETDAPPTTWASAVDAVYGVTSWRHVVRLLQTSPSPGRELGRIAPAVTGLAETGDSDAWAILTDSMRRLAETTAQHLALHNVPAPAVVGLAGGVWTSATARRAFRAQLATLAQASIPDAVADPLAGLLDHLRRQRP